jgi:DNA-nicking Smr family endonuclease
VIKKKDLSKEDSEVWQSYIKNPTDVYDKDLGKKSINRKERFKFDLHGYTLDEANKKVKEIIISCSKNKYREILLITGKGLHSTSGEDTYVSSDLSKLRFSVPDFINSDDELKNYIISIEEAEKKDGGDGAILIKLKNL